jgi:DNA-binding response OmpR family regulator
VTCPACDELRERVRYLESELGLNSEQHDLDRVRRVLNLKPQAARLLLALYSAKGRPVSRDQLLDVLKQGGQRRDLDPNTVNVQVFQIKRDSGMRLTEPATGHGYRINLQGMEAVRAALSKQTADLDNAL